MTTYFKGVRRFSNINKLKEYQAEEYKEMNEESSDRVQVISGYEGSGKSYLQLDLHEHWTMNIIKVKSPEEAFKTFCFQDADWAKALVYSKDKPFMMITHDEAVNIVYRKEANTKKNKAINKGFKKMRGKRFYHVMIIPQLHRMDKEMVEDRVKRLLFVFKENGVRYVAVYTKKRLDSLISELNRMIESTAKDVASRPQVVNCKTQPAFICRIPEYKGKFLEYYAEYKEKNMDDSIENIYDVIATKLEKEVKQTPKDIMKDKALILVNKGRKHQEVADLFDVSIRTVQRWVSEERTKHLAK